MSEQENTRILKYQLDHHGPVYHFIGAEVKPLRVAMQYGEPCIWVAVTKGDKAIEMILTTIGTGHEYAPGEVGEYIGTFQKDWFVGHVFCKVTQ